MTSNMEILANAVKSVIDTKYKNERPSLADIDSEADVIRTALMITYPISDPEFEELKKYLRQNILHTIEHEGHSLKRRDGEHQQGWYALDDNDRFFWNRYKSLLIKKWNRDVVEKLNKTTNDIMDDLGNPKSNKPFQRRGLLLGDVQSGKTATYTAVCNKAADSGYRVIIVLAGLMENLRVQTQERLDAEFVGVDSKYYFDSKADTSLKNQPVGVGKIPPFDNSKFITRFTSVQSDFNVNMIKANGLNLNSLNGTALFVVKKNKSVLNNLKKWLTKDEDILNLPLLLIDDEADNASVNTNKEDTDPTAINKAINEILYCFRQSTYLGITATPFANIFIDSSIREDGGAKDLFPRDFLTLLPIPEGYIGADKIFGNGERENWDNRTLGKYDDALIPIENDEQADYFAFKHKKTIADEILTLPESLCEAIRYFMLATAVSDSRFDVHEHRTMMVNVSRFTDVQIRVAELIENYVDQLKSDIDNYSSLGIEAMEKIKNLKLLHACWDKYGLETLSGMNWANFTKEYLGKSAKRVVVRSVNQKTGPNSLDYYNYKDVGMRVIAVGGNSLSRGITLEGLIVSYFYRNTMMYDTLLQMGRWFGYRSNYDDLFKIWIAQDAISWYSYITDAFNELKDELREMELQNKAPSQFGLKVRNHPGSLIITAKNKMRSGESVNVPITLSGRLIETPRIIADSNKIMKNNQLCERFLESLSGYSFEKTSKFIIWKDVPKSLVADFIVEYESHPWNLNFQASAISDYIKRNNSLDYWDIAVPFGEGDDYPNLICGESIKTEQRKIVPDRTIDQMLKVGERHVSVGQGGCAKIGLSQEEIDDVKENCKDRKPINKDYLIEDRKPLLLVHFLMNTDDSKEKYPTFIAALSVGFPKTNVANETVANYIVNTIELAKYADFGEVTGEDDDEDVERVC